MALGEGVRDAVHRLGDRGVEAVCLAGLIGGKGSDRVCHGSVSTEVHERSFGGIEVVH